MTLRIPGVGAERAFTRGQRQMRRWEFNEAVATFDQAIARDPAYAHVHMYKGLALAELGRFQEALAATGQATQLLPAHFVFPLSAGCVCLDEGQPGEACSWFLRAAALAPENSLVSAYVDLATFVCGDRRALHRLSGNVDEMPAAYKARLLLSFPRWSRSNTRWSQPDSGPQADQRVRASFTHAGLIAAIAGWLAKQESARVARRAQRLFASGKYERVVDLLCGYPTTNKLNSLLGQARTAAVKQLDSELRQLPKADDKRRRRLLLRRCAVNTDDGARYKDFETWITSYRASNRPGRDRRVAGSVFAEMADIDHRHGRTSKAATMCEQGRLEAGPWELDWIEARARATTGALRHARRLLERYAGAQALDFNARVRDQLVRELAEGPA